MLLNTDAREPFTVEPGNAHRAARRRAGPLGTARRGRRAGQRASAAHADSGRPRVDRRAPEGSRFRDRALARANAALPALEAGRRRLAAPWGQGAERREPRPGATAGALGKDGLFPEGKELPLEGPIALVDSIAPDKSPVRKHVVHVIFATDVMDDTLEDVASEDAAVGGHRLFHPNELDGSASIRRSSASSNAGDPAIPRSTSARCGFPERRVARNIYSARDVFGRPACRGTNIPESSSRLNRRTGCGRRLAAHSQARARRPAKRGIRAGGHTLVAGCAPPANPRSSAPAAG